MKINAIGTDYSVIRARNAKSVKATEGQTQGIDVPKGMTKISFRGGNKNQAIEYVAEVKPYYQIGGVATAVQDRRTLRISDQDPIITEDMRKNIFKKPMQNKAFVTPVYNGSLIYNKENGLLQNVEVPKIPAGLPETSAFKKYEGKYFITNSQNFQKYLNPLEFFKNEEFKNPANGKDNISLNNQVFILEDVTGGEKKMDFGGTGETKIKLFRVMADDNGKLVPTNDFQVFTDVTASWSKPYAGGGYSTTPGVLSQTWKGDGDARGAKAFAAQLEQICAEMSKNGTKFDPATLVLNDSQASYAAEYLAEMAAKGDEFMKGKKPTVIGHNIGDGYIQKTSYMNMFVNIADKELREAVSNDPNYIDALKQGGEAVNKYFEKLIPEAMKDKQGGVSPFMNAIYYARQGYIPMISTVSEGYYNKLISDPNFAPGTHAFLKELSEKGRFAGIVNAFEDPNMNPYTKGVPGYYAKEYIFPDGVDVNGQKNYKISTYKVFDEKLVNENNVDIKHVRDIKRQNKISLFERLDKDVIAKLESLKDVKGHEYDMSSVIAGLPDKKVKVYGHIDKKFLDEVKKPDSDIKLLTSWGRGDTQKGLDSVLEAFEQYALGAGKSDKNTVLVMGGALTPGDADSNKILKIINRMNENKELNGRFVYLDGFAPNKPLASAADFSVFPSRFAPCELTDLESMKVFCSPIVTDCQGLAQKNFDADFVGEAEKVTGYKTKHEYSMSLDELKKALSEEDKTKLDKDVKKFKDAIKDDYKLRHAGKELSDDAINEMICKNSSMHYDYNFKVLRPYRDKVIVDDLSNCFERALIRDRNKDVQTKMVANHLKQYTDWERNGNLSKENKSSAQLYRELHFQKDGATVKENDTLLYKLREQCKQNGLFDRVKANGNNNSTSKSGGMKKWFKAHKKASMITAGALGLVGLGYAGYKSGWLSPRFEEEKKNGHLSCVG